MTENEYGPFAREQDAWATEAYEAERVAWDANPVPGEGERFNLRILLDDIDDIGLELGAYDLSPLRQVAMYETQKCVALRGIIRRAYEAGKAAGPDGSVTEWALAYTHRPNVSGVPSRREIQPYPDEQSARRAVADIKELAPEDEPRLARHEVSPWEEVPGA